MQTIQDIQNFEGKYPKQLWYLFFSEMWERFCFYGMRGMLTFFMVDQLLMKEDVANLQYGATQAFVYAFTFVGGLFADKILGYRKSLFWGGIMMIIGSIILAIDPKQFFFLGIAFTVIGTGFFKPNISTMVGTLYKADDSRRDAGFSLFYSGINIGALLGGYVCIDIGKNYSWSIAFGLAGIVMIISLVTFMFTQKNMATIGLSPLLHLQDSKRKSYEYATYIGTLLAIPLIMTMVSSPDYTNYFMYTIGPITLLYLAYEMRNFSLQENKKLIAALIFILFSIFFWAFFEQSGGSLSLFAANNLENDFLGINLEPNGVNNAANSLFVIIFAPLLGLIWVWLNVRKVEPNTVVKFGLGFLFLALAFYTFYSTRFFANIDGLTSLEVFTLAYFIITFGELCLSPIGLSIMTKLSPEKLQGMMMGMWFLASAYGQYVAGILGAGMSITNENATKSEKLIAYTDGYQQLALYALIAGVVLIVISPLVRKLMQDVK
ncbi:MAG: peptide MFS transporter [Flavobacterium sp.]|jgi:POT family proton-dependent oligopeptide transporter|uniref:peptide MFS transporter n=1 Tax=Flavobacterium sp. TaxID=239 RepID=UPI0022CA1338|nr:peptide MFS transporter [Flavobacterium sp.]MCZ8169145.1 peptide MFS transporter [Flavobacterium sp.]MCZ8298113.1 peptide MFS transporter [Flavobacterium sp.]